MSKLPRPSSKGPPKSGGIPRPSGSFQPAASSTIQQEPCSSRTPATRGGPTKATPKSKQKEKKPAKEIDYLLPALSVFKPGPKDKKHIEKMKKEMIRRNAPQGEDIKKIREILKGMKGEEITVHEFVGLVAPYTGDNGTALRTILANELSGFRKMARRVYDTMTKDVSDVLMNEHIQLEQSSKEKHAHYSDKMMRCIDEIHEFCPHFDFEKYYTDPHYLEEVFPLARQPVISEDDRQLQLRQEAYHRLMWLRSEGERLAEENRRLQGRVHELKGRQRQEMVRSTQMEREHEEKRMQLEQAQEDLENKLDEMNKSVERSMVQEEKGMREDVPHVDAVPEARPVKQPPKLRVRQPENWNVKTAAAIEEKITSEALVAEASAVSVASSRSTTTAAAKKKIKRKIKVKRKDEDEEAFHFSPIKTPPCPPCGPKESSPFHYSPPKTPPEFRQPARQASPPRSAGSRAGALSPPTPMETVRVQSASTTRQAATRQLPRMRRTQAPRDSWSGFS